jgi:preprotein translocase subunit SecG
MEEIIIVIFIFVFIACILLCIMSPHWNQEQEQQKNKRPHDKKYTTHSEEKQTQSWCHMQEGKEKHI